MADSTLLTAEHSGPHTVDWNHADAASQAPCTAAQVLLATLTTVSQADWAADKIDAQSAAKNATAASHA